jgi:hypothetical protein
METATRDPRGRFKPGCSGNPAGKPPGTLNQATRLKQWLDAGDEEQAAQALIARAKEGNLAALRILFDRVDPKPKPRAQPVAFALPDTASFTQRFEAVFAAMAAGTLNPEEGLQLARFLETFRTIAERQAAAERAAAEAAKAKAEWQAYVESRDAEDRQRAAAEAKALAEAKAAIRVNIIETARAAAQAEAAARAKQRAQAKAAAARPAALADAKRAAAPSATVAEAASREPRAARAASASRSPRVAGAAAAPPRRDPNDDARPWPQPPAEQKSLNPTCIPGAGPASAATASGPGRASPLSDAP